MDLFAPAGCRMINEAEGTRQRRVADDEVYHPSTKDGHPNGTNLEPKAYP